MFHKGNSEEDLWAIDQLSLNERNLKDGVKKNKQTKTLHWFMIYNHNRIASLISKR